MDEGTKAEIITEETEGEFRSINASSVEPTSRETKSVIDKLANPFTETARGILEALRDFPEKLFALIALLGFIFISFSGNMKDWKNLLIYLIFLILDISFLVIIGRYYKK